MRRNHIIQERILPILEAQRELATLPDQFSEELEATIVTRAGRKVMAILSYPVYKALLATIESLHETLEIVNNPWLKPEACQSLID